MHNLTQTLRDFITANFFYAGQADFSDEDSSFDLGIIDSTGVLELVAFLEERFQMRVEDGDLVPENFDSICNLQRFIESRGHGIGNREQEGVEANAE